MVERYLNLKEEIGGSIANYEISSLLDKNLPGSQLPFVLWRWHVKLLPKKKPKNNGIVYRWHVRTLTHQIPPTFGQVCPYSHHNLVGEWPHISFNVPPTLMKLFMVLYNPKLLDDSGEIPKCQGREVGGSKRGCEISSLR